MPKFRPFGAKKYQLSNLLMKFSVYPISKVPISNLAFVLQNFEPNVNDNDNDRDCCITMYKEGDDIIIFPKAEPNESSLNRTDR